MGRLVDGRTVAHAREFRVARNLHVSVPYGSDRVPGGRRALPTLEVLEPTVRRWRPTPAMSATAAIHAAGAAALVWPPVDGLWVAGLLAANYGTLLLGGLSPRSQLLGPNLVRLPAAAALRGEVSLTFDDGPDPEITPRVLEMLERVGARASFFCTGEHVLAHPALAREIVAQGHTVESHSHRHSTAFGYYVGPKLRRELDDAQRAITASVGSAPRFFRAPFGLRNPSLHAAVRRLGLTYTSWTRRGYDTIDADASRVLGRLTKGLAAGDVLLLHDGVVARARREDPTVLRVLPRLLEQIADRGLRSVTLRSACGDALAD
jgi:peptidoglycan/xylan/chitin deacetylase (PgdA/CDA1 family)